MMNFKLALLIFTILFSSSSFGISLEDMTDLCLIPDNLIREKLAETKKKVIIQSAYNGRVYPKNISVIREYEVINELRSQGFDNCISILYPEVPEDKKIKPKYRMVDGVKVLIDQNETARTRNFVEIKGPKRGAEQVTPKSEVIRVAGVRILGPKSTDSKTKDLD